MAKIKYEDNVYSPIEELYRVETGYRISGGFVLATENLPEGGVIPPLAPLSVDMASRKATLVRRVRVVETGAEKKLKVSKGAALKAGVILSNGTNALTIDSVDSSASDYDQITAKGDTAAFTSGAVLFEVENAQSNTPKVVANFLNYAATRIEAGASVTALAQAYEVQTEKLYIPLTDADKTALGARFLFV